ncbi:hypothetical protein ACFWUP_05140 [Nocardia sp. NPDC058658]|uniref:hypothetical protein n=1 Tax=Nocardia sp. NPDC058658 TaxID=3346580 RepID=UPI00364680EA
MLVDSHRKVVGTEYHQFLLAPDCNRELINGQYPELPLAIFADDTVVILVGTRAGPVNVELQIHDSPPRYDDADGEDAAEGDLVYDRDVGIAVWSLVYGVPEQAIPEDKGRRLTPAGAHRYRVRIYARGKEIEWDGPVFGEPVEDYRIQIWPTTEPEPSRQTKHQSGR